MWYFETITSTLDRYQIELCKKALEENVVVYLETGCGKTHIAILLMYEMGHLIKKPQKDICIFLAPTVALVQQVLYFLIFLFLWDFGLFLFLFNMQVCFWYSLLRISNHSKVVKLVIQPNLSQIDIRLWFNPCNIVTMLRNSQFIFFFPMPDQIRCCHIPW